MRALHVRAPQPAGNPKPAVRVVLALVLASAVTLLSVAHPAPLAAKTRKAQKPAAKVHTVQKPHKVHSGQRVAQRTKKAQRRGGAKHRVARRVVRRAPDPDRLVIAQGDGSPVLQSAAEFLGRPYRFGSEGWGFDCSGFVRRVFAKIGIRLPHSAHEQFSLGERVARDELEPGDLVFFRTYRRSASHVGIYVGEDKFVHAATRGGQVQVDSLGEAYYARRYLGARRVES